MVLRAYEGGLRISVRDELDDDVLLDALRAELLGEARPMPPTGCATAAPPPRRC